MLSEFMQRVFSSRWGAVNTINPLRHSTPESIKDWEDKWGDVDIGKTLAAWTQRVKDHCPVEEFERVMDGGDPTPSMEPVRYKKKNVKPVNYSKARFGALAEYYPDVAEVLEEAISYAQPPNKC